MSLGEILYKAGAIRNEQIEEVDKAVSSPDSVAERVQELEEKVEQLEEPENEDESEGEE